MHSHGCGDWLQVESYWSDKERDDLEVIYYAFNDRQSNALRDAIESCPRYAKVEHRYLAYPTQRIEGAVSSMADHGILHRRTFTGSTFLKQTLAEVPYELPVKFDFLHLCTPFNLPGVRQHRDMKEEEWGAVLKRLEDRDTFGVVVNSDHEGDLPDHYRLIDLRGKTTMPQAIEVLKKASGYIGIDSCFAILAAQLFKGHDLLIRTRNPFVVEEATTYYAPHTEVNFLTPEIGKARYPVRTVPDRYKGVLVELKCNALVGTRTYGLGERVEIEANRAKGYIDLGLAHPYSIED